MKRVTISVLALVLILGGVVLTAQANHHEGKSDGKCPMGGEEKKCSKSKGDCDKGGSECPIVSKLMKKAGFYLENADEIGLTDDQVKQIKAIKMDAKKEVILGKAQMEVAMLDMESNLSSDPIDAAALDQLIDKNMAEMGAGAKKMVQQYSTLKQVLNADQKKKAKEIWKNAEKK